jgi:hypothetical protein
MINWTPEAQLYVLPRREPVALEIDRAAQWELLAEDFTLYSAAWRQSRPWWDAEAAARVDGILARFAGKEMYSDRGALIDNPAAGDPSIVWDSTADATVAAVMISCQEARQSRDEALIDFFLSREGAVFVLEAYLGTWRTRFASRFDEHSIWAVTVRQTPDGSPLRPVAWTHLRRRFAAVDDATHAALVARARVAWETALPALRCLLAFLFPTEETWATEAAAQILAEDEPPSTALVHVAGALRDPALLAKVTAGLEEDAIEDWLPYTILDAAGEEARPLVMRLAAEMDGEAMLPLVLMLGGPEELAGMLAGDRAVDVFTEVVAALKTRPAAETIPALTAVASAKKSKNDRRWPLAALRFIAGHAGHEAATVAAGLPAKEKKLVAEFIESFGLAAAPAAEKDLPAALRGPAGTLPAWLDLTLLHRPQLKGGGALTVASMGVLAGLLARGEDVAGLRDALEASSTARFESDLAAQRVDRAPP